jgi:hypothetical protein
MVALARNTYLVGLSLLRKTGKNYILTFSHVWQRTSNRAEIFALDIMIRQVTCSDMNQYIFRTDRLSVLSPPRYLIPPPVCPGVRVSSFIYLTCVTPTCVSRLITLWYLSHFCTKEAQVFAPPRMNLSMVFPEGVNFLGMVLFSIESLSISTS